MPLKSSYPNINVVVEPAHFKVMSRILQQANLYPDKIALQMSGSSAGSLTYMDLYGMALKCAAFFAERGLKHGDVACTYLPNCLEFEPVFLGILSVGGIWSGLNAGFNEREVLHQLTDSSSPIVITDGAHLETAIKVANQCPKMKTIVCIRRGDGPLPSNVVDWSDVMNRAPTALPPFNGSLEDTATLPYSSGTTGLPKGVQLSHINYSYALDLTDGQYDFNFGAYLGPNFDWTKEHLIIFPPMYHGFGMFHINNALMKGVQVVLLESNDTTTMFKAIEKFKPKMAFMPPPMAIAIAKSADTDKYDLSSVKLLLTGSAPLGQEMQNELLRKLPGLKSLGQGYGMTETGVSPLVTKTGESSPNSAGRIVPLMEMKVIDLSTGHEVNFGERGELCIRGPAVTQRGYLNRPEATKELIDAQGWVHSGDVCYVQPNGDVFIVDRIKDLLKVDANQVSPSELEDVLLNHPGVRDAGIIGVEAADGTGLCPRAFIVKGRADLTEHDVIEFAKANLAPWKCLKGGVQFIDEIPKNGSGKILRRVLMEKSTHQKA